MGLAFLSYRRDDVGAAAGGAPVVRLIDTTGERTLQVYDPAFLGGVHVTLGDVNGDGTPDISSAEPPARFRRSR